MLSTDGAGDRPCAVKRLGTSLCAALLLVTGCTRVGSTVFGIAPQAQPVAIAAANTLPDNVPVVVSGKMTEKCPVAGCWFIVRDQSGTIKVDTKVAGFVVSKVPLQTAMVVSGIIRTNDSQRVIEAAGLRF